MSVILSSEIQKILKTCSSHVGETGAQMIQIFGVILILFGLLWTITPKKSSGSFLPSRENPSKREFELWALHYTVIWILCFAVVIYREVYESFDENTYLQLCVSLALPFLLQPFLWPSAAEKNLPIFLRYSFKANLWIAVFSFIGNYWYTHYFYSVLEAKYTFRAHRINNVPISMFFATHFYFVTYHTFSNLILRKIETRFAPSFLRTILFWFAVFAFAYFTAFMETLTISGFPYYSFPPELKPSVYKYGSIFYGLYFIISFPVFYRLDEKIDSESGVKPHTVYQVVMEVMGTGMIVLLLLDFGRLCMEKNLNIPGKMFSMTTDFCHHSMTEQVCQDLSRGVRSHQ